MDRLLLQSMLTPLPHFQINGRRAQFLAKKSGGRGAFSFSIVYVGSCCRLLLLSVLWFLCCFVSLFIYLSLLFLRFPFCFPESCSCARRALVWRVDNAFLFHPRICFPCCARWLYSLSEDYHCGVFTLASRAQMEIDVEAVFSVLLLVNGLFFSYTI